ncbi:hypothetical protein SUGI_0585740 [Cryptomeria japonica]|uniref:anaphase-promoting complex subunit 13 isoform X1 n=1 Tax=Cryptomeria japonica TaxID=3369 RepID=UPI002414ABF5|nr:anaphase-promoting complex subunit 13 isoform X1 [Cryptomeria japonica]GLJ29699.1 hypothetical protein SUGI_0585740 [Cryptomeria japonica]
MLNHRPHTTHELYQVLDPAHLNTTHSRNLALYWDFRKSKIRVKMADLSMGILIDIVDEEWMQETLPDDEVPLPAGLMHPGDEIEDNSQEELPQHWEDKWHDLALHTIK